MFKQWQYRHIGEFGETQEGAKSTSYELVVPLGFTVWATGAETAVQLIQASLNTTDYLRSRNAQRPSGSQLREPFVALMGRYHLVSPIVGQRRLQSSAFFVIFQQSRYTPGVVIVRKGSFRLNEKFATTDGVDMFYGITSARAAITRHVRNPSIFHVLSELD